MNQISKQTGDLVADLRHRRLRELLRHVWQNSAFYRDYYRCHGIREKDLADIAIRDLPFLTKTTLMENFDKAVTDPRLCKSELEGWLERRNDPRQIFYQDFVVFNSSGSSGNIGISVYDTLSWRVMNATIARLLPKPENYPGGKTRVACYMYTSALQMPKPVYDVSIISLFDPGEQVVAQLNAFQPHRIIGYSSSVTNLAQQALLGNLHIRPKRILVTGDRLSAPMREKIEKAWEAPVHILYCSSESIYLAVQESGQKELSVADDLNIIEILNEDNQPVPARGVGRVVLTNLYNYALPILRYELGDYAIRGVGSEGGSTTIRDIRGRVCEALPVVGEDGEQDSIHPIVLTEFYAVGLERFQFVSLRPDYVRINYVAETDIDEAVGMAFQRLLDNKRALETRFEVRRVSHIDNDARTGKLPLVKMGPKGSQVEKAA